MAAAMALAATAPVRAQAGGELPIYDAHIHYSHDAWSLVPVDEVLALMRRAGLRRALVSSSNDDGTRRLHDAAPDLIVPSLRPYRTRGEISTWVRDPAIATHLQDRLRRYHYAAIGEFHLYGADADLPVPRRMIELAGEYGLLLHAHSDADAVERIFRHDPRAKVIWAHSGFVAPAEVEAMLVRHRNLWADLAYRTDMAADSTAGGGAGISPAWRALIARYPDRFMVGTDTFTPERLHYIVEHAAFTRRWLSGLPPELAERVAWRNAEDLIAPVWSASRARALPAPQSQASPGASAAADPVCAAPPGDRSAVPVEHPRVPLRVRFAPEPRIGQPFAMSVAVCPRAGLPPLVELAVDATMPEHRHGMNYVPRIDVQGPGRFDVHGMVFHMAGRWRIDFVLRAAEDTERLSLDYLLR